MKIENVNIRVLIPSEGLWLYNAKDKAISDKVYLGVEADETEWTEISLEEKVRLEALWAEEQEDN